MNRERDDNAARRAAQAYRLWIKGHSLSRIAQALGYHDESGARKAVIRGRKAQAAPPGLEDERDRERERLEIAYAGIADRVEDGDDDAVRVSIAIADRKAKLLGLDAQPDALRGAVNYTKRIILEDRTSARSDPLATLASESESEPAA